MSSLDMALDDVIKTKGSKRGRGEKRAGGAGQTKPVAAKTRETGSKAAPVPTREPASVRGRLGLVKGVASAALNSLSKAAAAAAKATAGSVPGTGGEKRKPASGGAPPAQRGPPEKRARTTAGPSVKNTETKLGMTLEDMIKSEVKKPRGDGNKKGDAKGEAKAKAGPKGKAKSKAAALGVRRNAKGAKVQGIQSQKWGSADTKRGRKANVEAWEPKGKGKGRRGGVAERNSFGWGKGGGGGGKGGRRGDDTWGSGGGRGGTSGRWSAGGEDWGSSGRSGGGAGAWGREQRSWGSGGGGGSTRGGGGSQGVLRDREPYWGLQPPVNGSARAREQEPVRAERRSAGIQIKVSNVPKDLDSRDIREAFEDIGRVSECKVQRGIAWVTFDRAIDAKKAMQTFDRGELNGQTIYVTAV